MVVEGSTHELNVTGNIFCWSTGHGIVVRHGAWGTITGNNIIDIGSCNPVGKNNTVRFADMKGEIPLKNGISLIQTRGYTVSSNSIFNWNLAPKMRFGIHEDNKSFKNIITGNPEQYAADVTAFLDLAKKEGKPFFLMANSHDPHRPFYGSEEERQEFGDKLGKITPPSRTYGPDEIVVPGFLPDLPGVRKELAQYFSSSKRADDTVGAILRALREAGHEKDTLVIFLSDHGMPLATAKWNTYLQSTRTPLIVRWPETVKPDSFDRGHFVSGIDFMPTILDSLGLKAPEGMDGSSFLPLLKGETQSGRGHVITAHYQAIHYYGDKEKRKDILERMVREEGWRYADEWKGLIKDYPIRCIREARYGYIYNQWSDGKNRYFLHYGMAGNAMTKAALTDPEMKKRVDMIIHRVPEELYDFRKDPDALHNLIGDPAHRETLDRLRGQLLGWMEQSGDPALPALREQLKRN